MSTQSDFHRRCFLQITALVVIAVDFPEAGACDQSGHWGDLVGRFVFDGAAPERRKLEVKKDVECCGKFDLRDESLIVGSEGGLANAFIYLRSNAAPICPDLKTQVSAKVVLDNKDCIFDPHCLTIWNGKQTLEIINSDPVGQNVAFAPLFNPPVNVVLPVGGKATYQFKAAERLPLKVICNYHPWESGFILARANPYMAVTAADGTFRIGNLPVGSWEFQVWHERVGYLVTPDWRRGRFEVDIQPGKNDLGIIKFAPSPFEE